MSFTHQRWENGPGPVVGCKLGVHRQHHAAADASSCRRQAQQHQTAFYSLSSFNITMHSPPSEVGPLKDNTIALESQTNVVMANKTSNRTSVPRLKVCSHELCTHSQANKKSEGCQIKARAHVHFKIASDEPKNRKTIVQSAVCNESPSSSSSSIGQGSNNSSCLSEKTSQESGEEKEVQSSLRSPLDHMSNLEDSLPIKRGLSRFYNGKSQSFTSLTDVSSVGDLAKPENPFVKKRKWLHEHGSSSKDRFGYPPNCHSYSGIAKNSMPSRGRANPSLFSAGGGSVDTPQVSRDFLGSSDQQQKRVVCPRSYSLGDLQGSGC